MSQRSRTTRVGAYAWIEYAGKILLVKQVLGPNAGKWSLPGGGVEFGEGIREALVRELQEECGLEISPGKAILMETLSAQTTWQHDSGAIDDLHWVGIIFSLDLNEQDMKTFHTSGDRESAGESKWFSKSEIEVLEISALVREWMRNLAN